MCWVRRCKGYNGCVGYDVVGVIVMMDVTVMMGVGV